jgi:hypothetical protein
MDLFYCFYFDICCPNIPHHSFDAHDDGMNHYCLSDFPFSYLKFVALICSKFKASLPWNLFFQRFQSFHFLLVFGIYGVDGFLALLKMLLLIYFGKIFLVLFPFQFLNDSFHFLIFTTIIFDFHQSFFIFCLIMEFNLTFKILIGFLQFTNFFQSNFINKLLIKYS